LIDGLEIENRSQAVEYLMKKALGDEKRAVILCGGPEEEAYVDGGLRFAQEVAGTPAIEKNIKKLKREGFSQIWIVGRDRVITDLFSLLKNGDDYGVNLEYVEEKESEGTADSLRLIKDRLDSTFLVLYGDILTEMSLAKLWNSHLQNSGEATLLLTTAPEPGKEGVVSLEGEDVIDFKQKPQQAENYVIFSCAFVAEPSLLDYEGNSLEEDVFPQLVKKERLKGHISSGERVHIDK